MASRRLTTHTCTYGLLSDFGSIFRSGGATGAARIIAVGCHLGRTIHQGHWIAYHCYRAGNAAPTWIQFNDGKASEAKLGHVANKGTKNQVSIFAYDTVAPDSGIKDDGDGETAAAPGRSSDVGDNGTPAFSGGKNASNDKGGRRGGRKGKGGRRQ